VAEEAPQKFRFGKERRIRRRTDFVRVQTHGERATSKHFVLLVDANPEDPVGPSRMGVVATKKVGDATMRNRIKRLCRECFRLWPDFIPNGIDLVVIAREGADQLVLAEVQEQWTKARPSLLQRCRSVLTRPKKPEAPAKAEKREKSEKKKKDVKAT
jgi:ribonuclease P protein component